LRRSGAACHRSCNVSLRGERVRPRSCHTSLFHGPDALMSVAGHWRRGCGRIVIARRARMADVGRARPRWRDRDTDRTRTKSKGATESCSVTP
jgi:hypothetical protein